MGCLRALDDALLLPSTWPCTDPDTKFVFLVVCPHPLVYFGDLGGTFTLSSVIDVYQGFPILVALSVCVCGVSSRE